MSIPLDVIVVPKISATDLAAPEAARADINKLVSRCRLFQKVVNERTQRNAAAAAQDARLALKRIEECRVRVKEAPWNLCKQIDALAQALSADLAAEVKRIDGALTSYVREQKRLQEEADRKAREEAAQQKAAADAEAERIRKEAEAKAAATADPVVAQQTLDLAAAQAKQVAASAAVAPARPTLPKVAGMQTRTRWTFRVKDLWTLGAHDRTLVRIEAAAGAIQTKINEGMRECPGLEIFEETSANTTTR